MGRGACKTPEAGDIPNPLLPARDCNHGHAATPARPAHHCGRGEDAGRGVGSCHRGHLQEARRQPLPSHRKQILGARAPANPRSLPAPKPRLALWGPISIGGAEPGDWEANGKAKRAG